jgi:glycosyltransferase involved in cell wall biosynthesis
LHQTALSNTSGQAIGHADQLTVMILTSNEEANIARTLDAIKWAGRILIIDSGSTDATLATVARCPQARVVTRKFDSFADQCNFGLTKVRTPWVLSLDADYELSAELGREICRLEPPEDIAGYRAAFVYRIYGKPLSATLYPPRTVLYRRDLATYRNEGHGHRVIIDGVVRKLKGRIFHDDRKPLTRWFGSQQNYARREADYLTSTPYRELSRMDRIRSMGWSAPIIVLLYTLLWERCIFDGWAGWLYVLQRTLAETIIALEIMDRRLRDQAPQLIDEQIGETQ